MQKSVAEKGKLTLEFPFWEIIYFHIPEKRSSHSLFVLVPVKGPGIQVMGMNPVNYETCWYEQDQGEDTYTSELAFK